MSRPFFGVLWGDPFTCSGCGFDGHLNSKAHIAQHVPHALAIGALPTDDALRVAFGDADITLRRNH